MTLRLLNPWRPMQQLRREMDRLLSRFPWEGLPDGFALPTVQPAVNLWETPEAVHLELELPGVKTSELDISVIGQSVVLKGRWPELAAEKATYHRRERASGEFTKVMSLPTDVDPDRVEARLEGGVLAITLPKAEAVKPKKIAVSKAD